MQAIIQVCEYVHLRVVVHNLAVGLVEASCQVSLSSSQTHSIADTLAQGTCTQHTTRNTATASAQAAAQAATHDQGTVRGSSMNKLTGHPLALVCCAPLEVLAADCASALFDVLWGTVQLGAGAVLCPAMGALTHMLCCAVPCCAMLCLLPVVTSTPAVRKFSGWPGVLESHWRNCLTSSIC